MTGKCLTIIAHIVKNVLSAERNKIMTKDNKENCLGCNTLPKDNPFHTCKDNKEKSNCCNAPVKVEGKTTRYYVCSKCNKACDIQVNKEKEIEDLVAKYQSLVGQLPSKARIAPYFGQEVDAIKSLISQAKEEERERVLNILWEKGHGGGNWRRLIIQLKDK